MVNIKIKTGTTGDAVSLCHSCDHSLVAKGVRECDEIVMCMRTYFEIRIPFPVRECSCLSDKHSPSKRDMEEIAWILLPKSIERKVGFVKADQFRKLFGEDER